MAAVLVTGGTGTLGSRVVSRLGAGGQPARILSHRRGVEAPSGVEVVFGDLASGEGLTEAVAGVGAVIHAASDFSDPEGTDVAGTRRLVAALEGGPHPVRLVYVSIVGVQDSTFPYYVAKHAAEIEVEASGLAWSIVRATQFHGFALSVLESLEDGSGGLTVPGKISLQPVEVDEVAERLVAVAGGPPSHRVEVFSGPEVLSLETMGRAYQRARGASGEVRAGAVHNPLFDAWRSGHQLAPGHAEGRLTWAEFLDGRYRP